MQVPGIRTVVALLVQVLAGFFVYGALPARADPASLVQTLMVVDQGNFLTFQWSFYFVDFPHRFVLRGEPPETVTLDDPATLQENLGRIVAHAFDLRIDGQPVQPERISPLAISPNRVCKVTLIYRGRPGAKVELRAPVLQYLPAASLINYEILPLNHAQNLIAGNLTARAGPFTQAVVFRETGDGHAPPPTLDSAAFVSFKVGLRTAWLNPNWLFLCLIVLLNLRPWRAVGMLSFLAVCWMGGSLACAHATGFSYRVPDLLGGLAVFLAAGAAARFSGRSWPIVLWVAAGLVNAGYDLQQVGWLLEERAESALAGLCLGFACSLFSATILLLIVVGECKRFPEFQTRWVPGICWVIAAFALLLPLVKMLFG